MKVLIAGTNRTHARFDGDEDPQTLHFAARTASGQVVAVLSLMPEKWRDHPAWQLRGMAVEPNCQRLRLGQRMLQYTMQYLRENPSGRTALWCNARTSAVGFYEKCGWTVQSPHFDIPGVGPHVQMSIPTPNTPNIPNIPNTLG